MAPLDRVTLEREVARLVPLSLEHVDALTEAALHPELWQWTPTGVQTRADMERYVREALDLRERGTALPFTTIVRESGQVIGSTRYGNIDLANRRVEIGWTWITPTWQRSAVNTEAKLLMLQYAFESLGCMRVELKTDVLNVKSRAAISRLGAREEGIFRKHLVTETGRVRDTVYYSILDDEWPDVRARLLQRLSTHTPARS